MTTHPMRPAGLLRRLAAMAYDSVVLAAVLMVAAFPVIRVNDGPPQTPMGHFVFQLYLAAVVVGFFGWFWVHGGQTLGMRAWRLRLVRLDGGSPGWAEALGRLAGSLVSWGCLGLGYLWTLFDRDRLAWHDRLTATVPIVLPCPAASRPAATDPRHQSGGAPKQPQRKH